MSAAVGTSNISFSGLQTSWSNASFVGGSNPGTSNIRLSEFAGATFTDGSSVPTGGAPISISSDFSSLTFGSSSVSVTGVSLAITDTTPNESSTVSNYATATISPSNANGTITIEFTTVSSRGITATPATTGFQSGNAGTNTMNYTFGAVSSNTNIGGITANVKQNGGSVIATVTSSDIIIQNVGRSDKRLKENIEFIKKSKSGIPIYQFNYLPIYTEDLGLDITKRYQGVLAQDLIELGMDGAVITDKRGFYEVLYDEIDVDFIEV